MTKPNIEQTKPVANTIPTNSIEMIPFSLLKRSADNVRTVKTSKASDKELLQSIRDEGLLQNLIVTKDKKHYLVDAGGRRLGCLEFLYKAKEITGDYLVPCKVLEEKGTLASVSENYFREDMHLADLFLAIYELKKENKSVEEIAVHFSIPQTQVRKLLTLAVVHPTIITAFKNDKIEYKSVIAYTVSSNTDDQLAFFKTDYGHVASLIKEHFLKDTIKSTDSVAKFVTRKYYKSVGGTETHDLFDDNVLFLDVPLVHKIAERKLDNEADKIRKEGWSWVEVSLDNRFFRNYDKHIESSYQKIPKKLNANIIAVSEELEMLSEEYSSAESEVGEAENWELPKSVEEDFASREKVLLAKHSKLLDKARKYLGYSDAEKEISGAVVCLEDGKVKILCGVMNADDVKREKALINTENAKNTPENTQNTSTSGNDEISNVLMESLTRYDNQLFQLSLLKNPHVAFSAFAFEYCYTLLIGEENRYNLTRSFHGVPEDKIYRSEELIKSQCYEELEQLIASIDKSWIKKDSIHDSFIAFDKLPMARKIELIGLCSALTGLSSALYHSGNEDSIYDQIQAKTGFVKAEHWRPTTDNYFKRLSVPRLHKLALEKLGEDWLDLHKNKPKSELVILINEAFNEPDSLGSSPPALQVELDKFMPSVMI